MTGSVRLNYFHNRPKAITIDITAYLKRIGQQRERPSLKYLKKLQHAHLLNIPFENLDIHYRQKIILDYKKIFEKIVSNGRGGFCYELNGLFYHLLYHLGFDCYLISARVKRDNGEFGKDFDHMAIVVHLDDDLWLVDVGFGNGIVYPKKIEKNLTQMDFLDYWRFMTDPDENLLLQVSQDASVFETKMLLTTSEKQIIQFMEMCDYHQTSPASSFTQNKLITKMTPQGRVTLTDRNLKILNLGETKETSITSEDEFLSKLQHYFGISFEQLIPKE